MSGIGDKKNKKNANHSNIIDSNNDSDTHNHNQKNEYDIEHNKNCSIHSIDHS